MPDIATPTPAGLVKAIWKEFENALPHERDRLDEARRNLAFYRGQFDQYKPTAPKNGNYEAEAVPRYSLSMQRIVKVLTGDLYKNGPKRALPDFPAADKWLASVYRANCVDSMMQYADRMSMINDVLLFQVLPSSDPRKPVRILPWDGSEVAVWVDPDDQSRPAAIAIFDMYNEQRRARLWTVEAIDTFMTREWKPGMTSGGTAYYHVKSAENPFGFLPFSSVHFDEPFSDFWTPSIGCFLASCNEQMNLALTENWASIKYNLRPVQVFRNTRAGWRPPTPVQPGDQWFLPGETESENDRDPDASYLQADAAFVAASWDDFQSYLDHVLEMVGVPKSSIRMEQDSARSGVSIAAEQGPLLDWAKSRQRPFQRYEDNLAQLVLTIGAFHLGSQAYEELGGRNYPEYEAASAELKAASVDPNMSIRWPKMAPEINGLEKIQIDQVRLDNKTTSRTLIVMSDENMSREEAEAYLEDVAEDLKWEQTLFAEVVQADAENALMASGKHPDQQIDKEPDANDSPSEDEDNPDE